MTNTKVSVIIPFYNTKRELFDRCVKSVLQQTYIDFECLIIDDGSKDEYAKILVEYEQLDVRIRLLHKENGGLGNARNYGVANSVGEYVFFLDSDDYISPYTFEIGMKLALESDADMIVGGLKHMDTDEIPIFKSKSKREIEIENRNEKVALIMHMSGIKQKIYSLEDGQIGPSACSRFVKRQIALDVQFENDKYWDEDNLWNISLVDRCYKILIADVCWYIYVINSNSMVRGYAGDRTKEFQIRAVQEYEQIKELWPECMQGAYYHIWDGLLRYCRTDTFQTLNPKKRQDKYLSFCKAIDFREFNEAIRNIDFNYERRFKYRLVKKTIKNLLLLNNKKLAFRTLEECIKRIKY